MSPIWISQNFEDAVEEGLKDSRPSTPGSSTRSMGQSTPVMRGGGGAGVAPFADSRPEPQTEA